MRKRAKRRNRLVYSLLDNHQHVTTKNRDTSVELIQYDKDAASRTKLDSHTDIRREIDPTKVNWFKVTGIADVEYVSAVCKNFGLHSFDVRDLLTEPHIVKVVLYDDVTFALVSGYHYSADGELEDEQMAFILGDNFVISFKETDLPVFRDVEKLIADNNLTLRRKGADFLLYTLLSTVNTMNNEMILKSEDQLFQIEDQLIMQNETIDVLHFLHAKRITHMQLKRFMSSFREEYINFFNNDNDLIKSENLVYFENLDDKLRTTSNNLDNFQESLLSLLDLYYNNNNNLKMNEIMKRLTVVSTIFIPLTFLVGVWGMNFEVMPELSWKYGYLVAWGIFIFVVIIVSIFLRKKSGSNYSIWLLIVLKLSTNCLQEQVLSQKSFL